MIHHKHDISPPDDAIRDKRFTRIHRRYNVIDYALNSRVDEYDTAPTLTLECNKNTQNTI